MIRLRALQEKDAPLMLEWMHDPEIQKWFRRNMLDTSLSDVRNFCVDSKIPKSISRGDNLHFAIVNNTDEYLGTISLKSIDLDSKSAEYAIATRKKAHGKGVAYAATGLILKKAFCEYGLHRVYLNVFADNKSAIKLYKRCGFSFEGEFREHLNIRGKYMSLEWYGMLENEYNESRFSET